MSSLQKIITASLFCIALTACSDSNNATVSLAPNPYAADELWLCKPELANNYCLGLDQTTTYVYSDNSQAVFEHTPAADPQFDCFYVYPTRDYREEPGNTLEPDNEDIIDAVLQALYNQAARFTEKCAVYAPFYRQMTIGTYAIEGGYRGSEPFALAYQDVDDAFRQYLRESGERPFVLIGHSQGSHMLLELLEQHFENDEAMRQRLVSALLMGPLGELQVPQGEIAGGTFDNIPLCTHATDTACIIAYDSVAAGTILEIPEELQTTLPCVNPTELGGNPGILENTVWGTSNGMPFPESITTPWAAYPGLHTAHCRETDGLLAIDTLEQERKPPVTPQVIQIVLESDTLHFVDANYPMGDLLRIVETQADNMP